LRLALTRPNLGTSGAGAPFFAGGFLSTMAAMMFNHKFCVLAFTESSGVGRAKCATVRTESSVNGLGNKST
jgi:hypothetical protein